MSIIDPPLVLCASVGIALLASGCGDDGGTANPSSDSSEASGLEASATDENPTTDASADGTSSSGDNTTVVDPDTSAGESSESTAGETGDDGPALGDTPLPACDAALVQYAAIVAENQLADPDPVVIELAYYGEDGSGTALQDFVTSAGATLGRINDSVLIDDEFIGMTLANGPTAVDLIDVETRVALVMSLLVRKRVDDVSKALPDMNYPAALHYADWDEAYCYYTGGLAAHVQEVDGDEFASISDEIQYGFEWGHEGIEHDGAAFGIDEFAVKPAKQLVEKNLFRAYDRLIERYAAAALADDDPAAARRAWGYFQLIEDRLVGRNTPGIAIIEGYLTADPTDIDVADLSRQLDIAWIKRARLYTDQAILDGTFATSEGVKGAYEGRTYAKIIGPAMATALDDFDLTAYLDTYDQYIAAVAADDPVAAQPLSDELTARNCAMQVVLGIAECTASADEPA